MEVVRLLLERSFEVNAVPGKWDVRTALQAASEVGHLEMVRLLPEYHANAEAGHYTTPLPVASKSGHLEVVRLLLEHMLTSTLGVTKRR